MLDEDASNTFGNIGSVPWHVTPSGIVARSAVLARSAALVNSSVPVLPIAHGKFDSLLETYDKELQCKKIHRASEATFHFLRSPTPTTTTMTMPMPTIRPWGDCRYIYPNMVRRIGISS